MPLSSRNTTRESVGSSHADGHLKRTYEPPVLSNHPTYCSRSGRMQPSDELEKVRAKIDELEEQVKGTSSEAVTTALQARLAALQEKEVLIMRGKQACSEP